MQVTIFVILFIALLFSFLLLYRNTLVYKTRILSIDSWSVWTTLYIQRAKELLQSSIGYREFDQESLEEVYGLVKRFNDTFHESPDYNQMLFNFKHWNYKSLTEDIDTKFAILYKQCIEDAITIIYNMPEIERPNITLVKDFSNETIQ